MERRFIVTQIGPDGDTILAETALPKQVRPILIDDLRASDFLAESPNEDRDAVFDAVTAMNYIGDDPPFPEEVTLCGRTYRIEELPDDPAVLDEFWTVRLASPSLIKLVCRLPGKLRYEFWPNESQHRGRPHCKVSSGEKAATFSIPEGDLLAGNIRPHETEARKTIRKHADELTRYWRLTRPDDQRTPDRSNP